MKNYAVLLVAGLMVLAGRVGVAQELIVPPSIPDPTDAPPSVLELPTLENGSGQSYRGDSSSASTSSVVEASDGLFSRGVNPELRTFDMEPALIESSGTWLRRGFWYAETDAVLLGRIFNRNNITLTEQITAVSDVFSTLSGNDGGSRNELLIGRARPGMEGVPRLTLGRFLFRDSKNRDHTLEFVSFGGGCWSQMQDLEANPNIASDTNNIGLSTTTTLQVPLRVDRGNPSFDGATSSDFEYGSRFNNFELNYRIKNRMRRDQMQLDPSGEWVRRASPTLTRSLFAGIRYFDLTETLDWNAYEVPYDDSVIAGNDDLNDGATTTGNYDVRTDNDLIGTQIGCGVSLDRARWSLEWTAKVGGYWNFVTVDSAFSGTAFDTSGDTHIEGNNLGFITDTALRLKWHLRQNLSLRAGVELMFVNALALAPFQANFVAGDGVGLLSSTQDSLFMGTSIGFEGYW